MSRRGDPPDRGHDDGPLPSLGGFPMFPLSTPLLPGTGIRMQIFEDRYKEMFRRQRQADRPTGGVYFGVAMISRGSEAGGGEVRTPIGCRAVATMINDTPDGRIEFAAVGMDRIRVKRWLEDDPFPRAEIEVWPDLPGPEVSAERRQEILELACRTQELFAELSSRPVEEQPELDWNSGLALYQLSTWARVGALDRFAILSAPSRDERAEALRSALEDQIAVLKFQQSC